ncbi:MAG: putative zinc-binding metallopeptidase [bacterium]|nr:putative zinc-binding metallopeptidase [bacterium]
MKKILLALAALILLAFSYYFFSDEDAADSQRAREEIISYETEVDGPDECSSYEAYDAEFGVCYFECASEQECEEMQNDIDDELATWADEAEGDSEPIHEDPEADIEAVASYAVTAGEKIALVSGNDATEYQTVWDEIATLSPNATSDAYIETYEVYDDSDSDTLAFVDDPDQNGKWRIAINLAGRRESTLREQKATLIHELAHIITLNTSQVSSNYVSCSTYELDEGCANQNSYLQAFYGTYWNGVQPPAEFVESTFVTEYAASDPVEDLAETFTFFVLEKDRENLGTTVKDQKIKLLYDYPDLVQVRKEMRNTLSRDVIRARKLGK